MRRDGNEKESCVTRRYFVVWRMVRSAVPASCVRVGHAPIYGLFRVSNPPIIFSCVCVAIIILPGWNPVDKQITVQTTARRTQRTTTTKELHRRRLPPVRLIANQLIIDCISLVCRSPIFCCMFACWLSAPCNQLLMHLIMADYF